MMANKKNIIQFDHLSKKYKGGFLALDDVSFSIKKGEIFGYIGPNGAGKTTTLKILVGLIKEYQGKVYINEQLLNNDIKDFYKTLGYLPQDAGFQEWRTVDHALMTLGRLSGMDPPSLDERIADTLEIVELQDVRDKKIIHLSGGMLQKLRLAQALLHDPEILILDEPMNGLDPASRYNVKNIIKKIARQGKTVLYSSHILSDMQEIADTIGILNHGKIVRIGTPHQIQEDFNVGNVIEIEQSEGDNDFGGLLTIPQVDSVENIDHKLLMHIEAGTDVNYAFHQVMAYLLGQKCRIRSLSLQRPSLEDAYMQIIGGMSA
ncbi:MAG: ATP-binding cassette domain-containing protein [Candidatus Hodarchaeota archaeon]